MEKEKLTIVTNVGDKTQKLLYELGFYTLEDLAKSNIKDLTAIRGLPKKTLKDNYAYEKRTKKEI